MAWRGKAGESVTVTDSVPYYEKHDFLTPPIGVRAARVDARRRAGRPVLTDREALNAWLRQAPFFRSRALAFIIDALRITNTP